jgi:hypothetical protein
MSLFPGGNVCAEATAPVESSAATRGPNQDFVKRFVMIIPPFAKT